MKILYFSWLREKIGKEEENLSPPVEIDTIEKLINWLKERSVLHNEVFRDLSLIRIAKNMETSTLNETISIKDEIAFFPPMTGG